MYGIVNFFSRMIPLVTPIHNNLRKAEEWCRVPSDNSWMAMMIGPGSGELLALIVGVLFSLEGTIVECWISQSNSSAENKNKHMSAFNPSDYDYLFKVLIIGDSAVGKSSVVRRYTDGAFEQNFISTIGVDFKIRTSNMHGKRIKLQIWDTAGQERFRSIVSSYYRGVHSVVLVYDMTDIESLKSCVGYWLGEVHKYQSTTSDIPILLVGNKCDIFGKLPEAEQQEIMELANDFALTNNLAHIQTSAKTGENIDAAFSSLAEKMMESNRTGGTSSYYGWKKPEVVRAGEKLDCGPTSSHERGLFGDLMSMMSMCSIM